MKRRDFLRVGAGVAGAPAILPLLDPDPFGPGSPIGGNAQEADLIRLSSNENPLGIPPAARKAIVEGFSTANRYPGSSNRALAEAVAERHGVSRDNVVLGSGSTEVLQMAVQARAVGRDRLRVVLPEPTFEDVFRYSRPHNVEIVRVPLLDGSFAHDLGRMRKVADRAAGGALVYVCNPNNPTGTLTSVGEVREWIEDAPDHFFLVDEAYFEFVDDPEYATLDRWALDRPNVVVTRTFSKVFGMAGIRVGYALARPETAQAMEAFATPTNPNHLGAVGARAALADEGFIRRSLETNASSRELVYGVLDELELPYMRSHTNFVMHRIGGEVETYRRRMADAGLRVGRPFPPFLEHNRLSLGTEAQMARWADTIRSFRRRGWV